MTEFKKGDLCKIEGYNGVFYIVELSHPATGNEAAIIGEPRSNYKFTFPISKLKKTTLSPGDRVLLCDKEKKYKATITGLQYPSCSRGDIVQYRAVMDGDPWNLNVFGGIVASAIDCKKLVKKTFSKKMATILTISRMKKFDDLISKLGGFPEGGVNKKAFGKSPLKPGDRVICEPIMGHKRKRKGTLIRIGKDCMNNWFFEVELDEPKCKIVFLSEQCKKLIKKKKPAEEFKITEPGVYRGRLGEEAHVIADLKNNEKNKLLATGTQVENV